MKGRKICAGLLIGGVIATAGVFAGCGPKGDTELFSKTSDVYGFAGATTAMIMSDDTIGQTMAGATELPSLKTLLQDSIQTTLDDYMNIFDSVVGGANPVETSVENGDFDGYDHKMTITMSSIEGKNKSFVLYFNETLAQDDSFDIEDSDEEERETKLDGKLVVGDMTFYVVGEKEIEDGEIEVSFRASLTKGDTKNYVEFSQEHSVENNKIKEEYKFEIYFGGELLTDFAFEMEKGKSGKIEVEYEQKVNSLTGEPHVISFQIEKTNNNEITIKTDNFFDIPLEIKVTAVANGDQIKYNYSIPTFGLDFNGGVKVI